MATLQAASALGDWLVVGLNSDRAVRELKGNSRPLQTFKQRKLVLEALRCVNEVREVDSTNVVNFLFAVRPHVWVKGGDYSLATLNIQEVAAAKQLDCKIRLVPERYKVHISEFLK